MIAPSMKRGAVGREAEADDRLEHGGGGGRYGEPRDSGRGSFLHHG